MNYPFIVERLYHNDIEKASARLPTQKIGQYRKSSPKNCQLEFFMTCNKCNGGKNLAILCLTECYPIVKANERHSDSHNLCIDKLVE